jgi:hypothetical protein
MAADTTATESSSDDQAVAAARKVAEAAKDAAANMAKVAKEASKQIGDDPENYDYGPRELLKTVVKMTSAGLIGAMNIAETAMRVTPKRPSDGMLVMAEHLTNVAQRTLANVKGVAEEATNQMTAGNYTAGHAIKSLTKLTDIAVVSGVEAAETVVIGPAKYAPPTFISDPYAVGDPTVNGKLAVAEDFKRPATAEAIPRERIRFDPPSVESGTRNFRMVVDEGGLPSGVYLGRVKVVDADGAVLTTIGVAIRL